MAAIPNRIVIGNDQENPIVTFENPEIISVDSDTSVSLIGEELYINQFTATVDYYVWQPYVFKPTDYGGFMSSDSKLLCSRQNYDIRLLPYGTKIVYYAGDTIAGVFYVKTVERVQRAWYKISAVSAIGLLDKQYHAGGIYTGQYMQNVIAEILGNDFDYIVDGTVAVQRVYGWLPYDTKRANLYQLLLAYGVEIVLGDSGAMYFTFPEAESPIEIPTDRVFEGGKVIYDEPASRVEVNEHSYHYDPNVEEATLFDNSSDEAVTNAFVKFDEPIYPSSIRCSSGNLTISTRTTNYAIVSGSGILSGKPYVHNVRMISQDNASAPVEKVVAVQDATLISFINADNVLARLSEYYFNATRVEQDIKVEMEKPGLLYTTQNPFGELITGYISRMSKSVTSFARAKCRFIQNYMPVGSGAAYTERVLIPLGSGASQTWTIPASVFAKEKPTIRIVLIGKGRNGTAGKAGSAGQESVDRAGTGGAGGSGGTAGLGGNIFIATIEATGLTTLTFSNSGNNSVMSSTYYNYSSANGAPNSFGYFDILNGAIYAMPGINGVAGANGGHGDKYSHNTGNSSQATDGGNVVYNGTTYHGGAQTPRRITSGSAAFPNSAYSGNLTLYKGGGGGGGAAVGSNGYDSYHDHLDNPSGYWWNWNTGGKGANGAAGANASASDYGRGGNGGHGGGGGGAGAGWESWNHEYSSVIGTGSTDAGKGGTGGAGGAGSYGCAIIYY